MEILFGRKRRPSLCLSLSSNSPKRPFTTVEDSAEPDKSLRSAIYNPGAVGLGIIAKVSDQLEPALNQSRRIFMSPMLFRTPKTGTVDPLSKSYSVPRKSIDFDCDDGADDYSVSGIVKGLREQGIGPYSNHFLSCCRLCKKRLDGLDIFMYRGYKAFCSPECRDEYMKADKCKDMDEPSGPSGSSVLWKKVAAAP